MKRRREHIEPIVKPKVPRLEDKKYVYFNCRTTSIMALYLTSMDLTLTAQELVTIFNEVNRFHQLPSSLKALNNRIKKCQGCGDNFLKPITEPQYLVVAHKER